MKREDSVSRLRRLLAVLPWISAHQGATIAEIGDAFDISEATVRADLELVPLCGLPPYTPDRLVDVEILDGRVTVRFAEYFERPLRLTRDEGVALVATARTLLALSPGGDDGPLATGLQKLEEHLGVRGGLAVSPADHSNGIGALAALRQAVAAGEAVEVEYFAAGRGEATRRRLDPHEVFFAEGNWYCWAYCHLRRADRLFRVDRVREVTVRPGERAERRPSSRPADIFHPRPEDPRVEVELPADAAWVVESYPTEEVVDLGGGRLRVRLVVSERAWLERLLLRCGPDARVVGPPELVGVGAGAARRLLARYAP